MSTFKVQGNFLSSILWSYLATFRPQPSKVFPEKFILFFSKKPVLKKFLIFSNFQEMELSYIFFKKFFLYFGKGIFRTLACLELEAYSESETYSEHCQTSTMKCFAKNSYLALFPASALNFFPKKPTLKNFLIFPETETPKKFLIFQETETLKTSHISGSNFPSSKNKKNPL